MEALKVHFLTTADNAAFGLLAVFDSTALPSVPLFPVRLASNPEYRLRSSRPSPRLPIQPFLYPHRTPFLLRILGLACMSRRQPSSGSHPIAQGQISTQNPVIE